MNANLFAMAQSQVSEGLRDCHHLTAGASRGAVRRMTNMIAAGAVAAFALGSTPEEAIAQSTPQQFQQQLELNQQRHQQDMERDRQQHEFNRERRQQDLRNQKDFRRDAQRSQVKQAVAGGIVAALTGAVVGAIAQSAQSPRPIALAQNTGGIYPPGYAPSRQAYQAPPVLYQPSAGYYDPRGGSYDPRSAAYDPRGPVQQPAFYSPRDLGMPERFSQVSQRAGIGMAAPGSEHFNLNDGSATSDRVVRALSQLKGSLDHQQQAQRYLDDIRLSSYQIAGQQQQQANQAVFSANSQIDRSIENYMRMSNAAALEGKNTQAFNMLAAKMVLEGIAPDQRINMRSQPQQRYEFSPRY